MHACSGFIVPFILTFYFSLLNIFPVDGTRDSWQAQLKSRVQRSISFFSFFFSCGMWSCPAIIKLWSNSQQITLKLPPCYPITTPKMNKNLFIFLFFLFLPEKGMCKLKVIFRFCLFPDSCIEKVRVKGLSRVGSFKRNLSLLPEPLEIRRCILPLSWVPVSIVPCAWSGGHLKTWRLGKGGFPIQPRLLQDKD